MSNDRSEDESKARTAAQFATTHWSVVLAAGDSASPDSKEALEKLCRTYWYPLYAYVRRCGFKPEDAEDLTQDFFAVFLEKGYLERADRVKGRFRTFLLSSMQNFLRNAKERLATWKRGGRLRFVSWDSAELEERYGAELRSDLSPEEVFEKRWAATLLEQVLDHLRKDFDSSERAPVFETLKDYLWGDIATATQTEAAARLGMKATAFRVAVYRLRRRFRETLREEIAHTVTDPAEIDDEIRYLIGILGE